MQPDVPGGILKNSKTPDDEATEKVIYALPIYYSQAISKEKEVELQVPEVVMVMVEKVLNNTVGGWLVWGVCD